ncbi:holin family protein [Octadecabacter sp. 1_MG-2023]|uniref:holin family protein n=1 Tax=unclassified Octadecabacter TaxID=196158 RepID=UPI001C09EFB5|nr:MULTISPECIES: holin family protein [unclassified Octadecabacter]MBU2993453.1 holin family protein [Octadecabacter sp. B2R22]MDO6733091.1 holin family protein [Octadecabacter sp. 1_MG-2023]
MGLIERVFTGVFGDGRNVIVETAEVFRENAESGAARDASVKEQAMQQFASEFAVRRVGVFDRLMDGLNRLPRPLLAFGTIGLFIVAMVDPIWFASRMQGISLVPDPLWWLMGAIVSFYFGARHQAHSQDFQRSIAQTLARVPTVIANTQQLDILRADTPQVADAAPSALATELATRPQDNPALDAWSTGRP